MTQVTYMSLSLFLFLQLIYTEWTDRVQTVMRSTLMASLTWDGPMLSFVVHLLRDFGGSREVASMIYDDSFVHMYSGYLGWLKIDEIERKVSIGHKDRYWWEIALQESHPLSWEWTGVFCWFWSQLICRRGASALFFLTDGTDVEHDWLREQGVQPQCRLSSCWSLRWRMQPVIRGAADALNECVVNVSDTFKDWPADKGSTLKWRQHVFSKAGDSNWSDLIGQMCEKNLSEHLVYLWRLFARSIADNHPMVM